MNQEEVKKEAERIIKSITVSRGMGSINQFIRCRCNRNGDDVYRLIGGRYDDGTLLRNYEVLKLVLENPRVVRIPSGRNEDVYVAVQVASSEKVSK